MLRANVLPKWHWRDGRTITSREVIELLDKVVERGAPVMANNLAQMLGHMFKFAIHRGTLENSPVQLLYRPGGKPRRRKRVFSEEELRSFVTNIDSICRTRKRKHVLRCCYSPCNVAESSPGPSGQSSTSTIAAGRSRRHTARTSASTLCR
jgi:hypothetical protein